MNKLIHRPAVEGINEPLAKLNIHCCQGADCAVSQELELMLALPLASLSRLVLHRELRDIGAR